jgi:Holliday junction resolvase
MASNHGKRLETDMLKSLRTLGYWAERFTDRTFGHGNLSVKSPPDLIAVENKHPILIELKAVRVRTALDQGSIPLTRLPDHQRESLQAFDNKHGSSYVMVMFYEGTKAQKRITIQIPISYWTDYLQVYHRKSVVLSHLKRDLPPKNVWVWVGRGKCVGPWVPSTMLSCVDDSDSEDS